MPHVDDGTLHAFIDGALRAEEPERARQVAAHLETCADCRARLEEAAETRDRAAGILAAVDAGLHEEGAAGSAAARPDFADVLARADRDRQGAGTGPGSEPTGRWARQYRWTRGLAWAATLVIALGAGYMVRDLVGPTGELRNTSMEQSAPPVEQSADAASRPALTRDAVEADTDAVAGGADTDAVADGANGGADGGGAMPEGDAGSDAARDGSADEEAAARSTVQRPSAEPGVAADAPTAMEAGATTSPWRSATMEEAEVAAGPIHVLPGAALAAVETADGRVRTRQVLRDGVEVLVVQSRTTGDAVAKAGEESELEAVRTRSALRADAAPAEMADVAGVAPTLLEADLDSLAAVTGALATVTIVRDGVRLELTGRLPADLLRALGATASPGG
ncbi:MAG: zf-HC2 domain-containing protein [Longimicrobiales bacterium]|nr:zf-HC2 domain-containing protein [Longimicrobiales bacterium]